MGNEFPRYKFIISFLYIVARKINYLNKNVCLEIIKAKWTLINY